MRRRSSGEVEVNGTLLVPSAGPGDAIATVAETASGERRCEQRIQMTGHHPEEGIR